MKSKFHYTHWRQHVALDVGTATTRIAMGQSAIIEKPSRVEGKRALSRGVVVDAEAVLHILKPLLDGARIFGVVKPFVLACAPSDACREERQLLMDSISKAGAASVCIIPEPLAAAIGSGLDVSSPYAQMVIDIGEGVTDCAIIRESKISATCAIRVGCEQMRRAIVAAARERGAAALDDSDADLMMRTLGLGRSSGPAGGILAADALQPVLEEIVGTVESFIRDLPDELGCEVIESGICLTGGGALIPGVGACIEQRTGIGITIASNPRGSVVEGARNILPVVLLLNNWK
jgi:rod shape-determining protein MreB